MHLVGFIIRIFHDARSLERQIRINASLQMYGVFLMFASICAA